jgi:hypothetical protein
MKKVNVTVKVDLLIRMDEDADISEILNEMDYSFTSTCDKGDIEDTTILDYEVTDVR